MAIVAPTETRRAAIYCRVSSGGQERDGTSLETQEAACRQYAADHGYIVEDRHVYREVHSGAELHERKHLSALRQAVSRGELSGVICHAVDRLSRNQAHLYIVAEDIEAAGVRLEFVTEDFEHSAVGKFIRSAKAFAAEVEREKFRERSGRGKLARVAAGKLMHGKAPLYGYTWPDEGRGRYVINPVTAPIVRRLFAGAAIGKSLRRMAADLTAEGIPPPRGGICWDFVAIGRMLADPAYKGEAYAFRTKRVDVPGRPFKTKKLVHLPREEWVPLPPGTIPAIVDDATFQAAQERRRRNQAESPRRTRDPEAYLLRGGYARCGYCRNSMAGVRNRDNTNVYACTKGNRSTGTCTRHGISVRILDRAVWERVESLLTRPDVIADHLERMQREDPSETDLANVERALAEVGRQKARLTRALTMFDDEEAAAPIVAEMEVLQARQRSLEREQEAVRARRAGWEAASGG